jgi:hypothetical protein
MMTPSKTAGLMVALFVAAAVLPSAADALSPKRKMRTVLDFDSRLKDENNRPVSGIFPMVFALKKKKKAKPFWKERHWVAVDNGRYSLQLGKRTKLPKRFDPKAISIVVKIEGAGTILDEPLAGADASLSSVEDNGGKRIVQYAEKAGFAYDSEHATVADRLGEWTAKLLTETLKKLKKKKGKTKVKVGRNRINMTSAGGVGGIPFEQICPPGTVAVGLRGGAGIYIDNVQIVCAPLE